MDPADYRSCRTWIQENIEEHIRPTISYLASTEKIAGCESTATVPNGRIKLRHCPLVRFCTVHGRSKSCLNLSKELFVASVSVEAQTLSTSTHEYQVQKEGKGSIPGVCEWFGVDPLNRNYDSVYVLSANYGI